MEGEDGKETKPKPLAASGDELEQVITVKLVAQDGAQPIDIKAKKKTKISRIIEAYAQQRGIQPHAIKLLNDQGNILRRDQSLKEATIEDGDQLDVMMQQEGGGRV